MPEATTLIITPDRAALPSVAAAIAAYAPDRDTTRLALALEELLDNIIEHANPTAPIRLRLWREGDGLTAELSDDGPAHDPFAQDPPDIAAALEDRGRGGLGIHFVRTLMHRIAYRRENGRNIVTISES